MADWGKSLYEYYQKNGGVFRGSIDDCDGMTATLDILRGGVHVILAPLAKGGKKGKYSLSGCAQVSLELKRPYSLTVRKRSIIEKVKKMILKKEDEGIKTGYRRCDSQLFVTSDDEDFTRTVLTNGDMRRALLESKGLMLKVKPLTPDGCMHSITVTAKIELEESGLTPSEVIDSMVETASRSWRALTSYEMPEKKPEPEICTGSGIEDNTKNESV